MKCHFLLDEELRDKLLELEHLAVIFSEVNKVSLPLREEKHSVSHQLLLMKPKASNTKLQNFEKLTSSTLSLKVSSPGISMVSLCHAS